MRFRASLLICLAIPALVAAQAQPTVAEHIALGDSAHAALAPQQALGHYRAALAHDSTNYAALWKAGREAVDIAKQVEGKGDSSGQAEFRFNTPDDLGGLHGLWVDAGTGKKTAMHWIVSARRGSGARGHSIQDSLEGGLDRDRQHLQGRLRQQLHRLRVRL